MNSRRSGFSVTQLIVLVCIIGIVALLAVPAIKDGLDKRDLIRAMNNSRELYLAAFRMATDAAAKADSHRAWPGDYPTNSLAEYCTKLVQNDYLKPADLQRILSAPGAECSATMSGPPATLLLAGKPALKLYKVKASDASNTIFAATSNYVYDTPLDRSTVPFGDAGFVLVRKSGDAGVYKAKQATASNFESPEKFRSDIGILSGREKENVTPGDAGTALTNPK